MTYEGRGGVKNAQKKGGCTLYFNGIAERTSCITSGAAKYGVEGSQGTAGYWCGKKKFCKRGFRNGKISTAGYGEQRWAIRGL